MPNPAQSDLHVNVPLTNVSVAWMQDKATFIADKVFPRVPVQKQSDLYWKYSKSDWRKTEARSVRPGPSLLAPVGSSTRTSTSLRSGRSTRTSTTRSARTLTPTGVSTRTRRSS